MDTDLDTTIGDGDMTHFGVLHFTDMVALVTDMHMDMATLTGTEVITIEAIMVADTTVEAQHTLLAVEEVWQIEIHLYPTEIVILFQEEVQILLTLEII